MLDRSLSISINRNRKKQSNAPTTDGFAGSLSLNLFGILCKSSSGSISTAFNFFCNNLAMVCRPEAGGPRTRTLGTIINKE